MSTKLIDPESLYVKVQIDFAAKYGLNEAILAGKMFRLQDKLTGKTDENGDKWIKLTLAEWHTELPFLSEPTIRRAIDSLEEQHIFLSRTFTGRPKYYRLNSDFIANQDAESTKVSDQNDRIQPKVSDQNDQMQPKVSDQNDQIEPEASDQSDQIEPEYLIKMITLSDQNDQLPIVHPIVFKKQQQQRAGEENLTEPQTDGAALLAEFESLFTAHFGKLSGDPDDPLTKDAKEVLKTFGLGTTLQAMRTALVDRAGGKPKTWGYVKGILRRENDDSDRPAGHTGNGRHSEQAPGTAQKRVQPASPRPSGPGIVSDEVVARKIASIRAKRDLEMQQLRDGCPTPAG